MNGKQQKEVGLKLMAIRERARIPRREMAERLGVSYAHLNMIETGRATLSLEKFLAFLKECEVFSIEVEGLKEYYQ